MSLFKVATVAIITFSAAVFATFYGTDGARVAGGGAAECFP
jgi:hypothetical protein